jgi:carbamate kinase
MSRLTVSDATRLLAQDEFPPGSMGPKVESAVRFVERGGAGAIITCADRLLDAVEGSSGTRIVMDGEGPSATAWPNAATVAA